MSKGESTASGVSTDDKIAAIQYKPVMSLAGNNALVHYEKSHGDDQISHALSNTHGLYESSCNFVDLISVHSLNPGELPGSSLTNGLDIYKAGIGQNASCAAGDFKLGLSLVRELWFTDCSYMYNLHVHVEQKDVLNHRLVGFVAAILIFHYYNTTIRQRY